MMTYQTSLENHEQVNFVQQTSSHRCIQKKGMKAGSKGDCYSIAYTTIMKSQCCTVFTIQHLHSRDLHAAKGGHICLHHTSTCLMQLTPSLYPDN